MALPSPETETADESEVFLKKHSMEQLISILHKWIEEVKPVKILFLLLLHSTVSYYRREVLYG